MRDVCSKQVAEIENLRGKLLAVETEQSKIGEENETLKTENSRLVLSEYSTSEALEKLNSLHAKTEKDNEGMKPTIKKMEEDFQKQETAQQELQRQYLAEISTVRTKLSVAESHNQKLGEQKKASKRDVGVERARVAFLKQRMCIQQEESKKQTAYHWDEIRRIKEEKEMVRKENAWQTSRHAQIEKEKQCMMDSLKDFQKEMQVLTELTREQLTEISSYRRKLVIAESHRSKLEEELNKCKKRLQEMQTEEDDLE